MKKLLVVFLILFQAAAVSAAVKEWTVLVYWAVDNDLYEFSKPYLHEFEKVGSNPDLNIVVQYDFPKSNTQRYLINKKTRERLPNEDLISSTLVETLPVNSNSANSKTLSDFIVWGKESYPAKKYLLVIASHGSNWSGVIQDTTNRQYMSLNSLRTALVNQKLDLVLFDACKMAFIETLIGLSETTPLIVASPLDLDGFNHVIPLTQISKTPEISPEELATQYVNSYPANDVTKTHSAASALFLKNDPSFIKSFNQFAGLVIQLNKQSRRELFNGLSTTINEDDDLAFDLFEVIEQASALSPELKLLGSELLAQKSSWILSASVSEGKSPSGLSITCAGKNSRKYKSSAFGQMVPDWVELCSKWKKSN